MLTNRVHTGRYRYQCLFFSILIYKLNFVFRLHMYTYCLYKPKVEKCRGNNNEHKTLTITERTNLRDSPSHHEPPSTSTAEPENPYQNHPPSSHSFHRTRRTRPRTRESKPPLNQSPPSPFRSPSRRPAQCTRDLAENTNTNSRTPAASMPLTSTTQTRKPSNKTKPPYYLPANPNLSEPPLPVSHSELKPPASTNPFTNPDHNLLIPTHTHSQRMPLLNVPTTKTQTPSPSNRRTYTSIKL